MLEFNTNHNEDLMPGLDEKSWLKLWFYLMSSTYSIKLTDSKFLIELTQNHSYNKWLVVVWSSNDI